LLALYTQLHSSNDSKQETIKTKNKQNKKQTNKTLTGLPKLSEVQLLVIHIKKTI